MQQTKNNILGTWVTLSEVYQFAGHIRPDPLLCLQHPQFKGILCHVSQAALVPP